MKEEGIRRGIRKGQMVEKEGRKLVADDYCQQEGEVDGRQHSGHPIHPNNTGGRKENIYLLINI
jgi:hypothetical protein